MRQLRVVVVALTLLSVAAGQSLRVDDHASIRMRQRLTRIVNRRWRMKHEQTLPAVLPAVGLACTNNQ